MTTGIATAGLALTLAAAPAFARDDEKASKRTGQTSEQARDRAGERSQAADRRDTGDMLGDAWLVTKVKAQFWDEDALDNSDINVDAREGVIILRGTVASQAGKARAAEIARTTEGVKRVDNRLTVGMASRDRDDDTVGTSGAAARDERDRRDEAKESRREARDVSEDARDEAREARESARETRREAQEEARETSEEARETAREAREDARDESKQAARGTGEAVGTAGEAVTDGWITTKVKTSFVGEDALENSDIDVDTNDGTVTLSGTVASEAGRARAIAIAKKIEGVRNVKDELRVVKK